MQDGRTLQDSAWQKFTLGLSNVTVPELTTDMMMSNTELYAHPQAFESEPRDTDGGDTKNEMKRDDGGVGEELQDSAQDQEKGCESNISKPQPDPSEHPEPDSQCQEEEDDVDIIPPSQEKESTSLSPEDILFAPTQAMVECVSQPRVQEQEESLIPEAQLEEMDKRKDESLKEEQPSHLPQQITRRVYRSEGGALRPGAMARVRGTKSLGMDQDPTEKRESSSDKKLCCTALWQSYLSQFVMSLFKHYWLTVS